MCYVTPLSSSALAGALDLVQNPPNHHAQQPHHRTPEERWDEDVWHPDLTVINGNKLVVDPGEETFLV